MAKTKKLLNSVIIILLILLLVKCANQMAPTGGDPDLIPPTVVEIYPPAGTINYQEDYFEITFSEYVEKRSVQESIFISPEIEGEIEYDWSGTSLEVSFEDSLKENTTYSITVGTDAVDLNNRNNMAEAYNFAFSTGPEIDKGELAGKVFDPKPDGIIIAAYKTDVEEYDPFKTKPAYRSQVGKNGKYKFLGLAPGTYRVIALRDEYRDYLYNVQEDAYGMLYKDVVLTKEEPLIENLDFMLTREDTTAPDILSVTMTDQHHILVEFSEFIDSSRLGSANFHIEDSTSSKSFNIKQLFKGAARDKNLFVTLSDSLDEEAENYLIVKNLFDNYSNERIFQSTSITVNTEPDTAAPEMIKFTTDLPENKLDINNPELTLKFNDAINKNLAATAISISDFKKRILPITTDFIDDGTMSVKINQSVESRSEFLLSIDMRRIIDLAGNRGDSVFTVSVFSINELDFSGVLGKVINADSAKNLQLVLEDVGPSRKRFFTNADSSGNFEFKRIIPSKYLVWCYEDVDSTNNYSFGDIMPFKGAEEFAYYPDTLNLRARWPVGDVFINFK